MKQYSKLNNNLISNKSVTNFLFPQKDVLPYNLTTIFYYLPEVWVGISLCQS